MLRPPPPPPLLLLLSQVCSPLKQLLAPAKATTLTTYPNLMTALIFRCHDHVNSTRGHAKGARQPPSDDGGGGSSGDDTSDSANPATAVRPLVRPRLEAEAPR